MRLTSGFSVAIRCEKAYKLHLFRGCIFSISFATDKTQKTIFFKSLKINLDKDMRRFEAFTQKKNAVRLQTIYFNKL